MINWICRKLAECFDAHLTDEEQLLKAKIDRVRVALQEFNDALNDIPHNSDTYMYYTYYGDRKWCRAREFSITSIESSVYNRKVL
jgi:hypothetical protein